MAKKLLVFLSLLVLGAVFASQNVLAADFVPNRLIVKFKDNATATERENVRGRFLSRLILDRLNGEVLEVKGNPEILARIVKLLPGIEFAEPDFIATILEVTTDPFLNDQWGLFKIQATATSASAWNFSKSSSLVKVAVVDTGIDESHPDLSGKVTDRKNCTDSPTDQDKYGHGTHVAGIAAASTNNEIGVAGVGYNANLLNAKALNDSGSGAYSWISNCIVWSTDNGAKVINLSLGGRSKSLTLENAVNYAWNHGVVVVAAAGNNGNTTKFYPAAYPNVISVAATDVDDKKASWSTYGKWVSVAAPGVNIFSTFPTYSYAIGKSLNYDYGSGTSMASPHVAGLAALVWSTSSGNSNLAVRNKIQNSADRISKTGSFWKYGRINALRAVSP